MTGQRQAICWAAVAPQSAVKVGPRRKGGLGAVSASWHDGSTRKIVTRRAIHQQTTVLSGRGLAGFSPMRLPGHVLGARRTSRKEAAEGLAETGRIRAPSTPRGTGPRTGVTSTSRSLKRYCLSARRTGQQGPPAHITQFGPPDIVQPVVGPGRQVGGSASVLSDLLGNSAWCN
jgi:hypothetical protein